MTIVEASAAVAALDRLGVARQRMTLDSRSIKPGDVFVAIPGSRVDGRQFIRSALDAGAAAVLQEAAGADATISDAKVLGISNLAAQLGHIAGEFYAHPAAAMRVFGVTGTNGKTSITNWLMQAYGALGMRCAAIGTLGVTLGEREWPTSNTTPDAVHLQTILRDLREAVGAGTFREDLYYRIGRPAVYLPPLRERLEEIPHFVIKTVRAEKKLMPSPLLVEACLLRPWPGNVRELCSEVRAAATLAAAEGSDVVLPKHLDAQAGRQIERTAEPPSLAAPPSPSRSPDSAKVFAVPEALLRKASEALGLSPKTVVKLLPSAVLSELFAEFDRLGLEVEARTQRLQARAGEALLSELLARDFNQSEVAEALGTSRTTLLKLMEDLRLPRANDLSAEQIEAARARVGGDLEATARLLRVSAQALKKRLASLQLR